MTTAYRWTCRRCGLTGQVEVMTPLPFDGLDAVTLATQHHDAQRPDCDGLRERHVLIKALEPPVSVQHMYQSKP